MGERRAGGRATGRQARSHLAPRGAKSERSAQALIEAVFPREPAAGATPRNVGADAKLQNMLSDALARLARQTGAERLYAWGLRPDGSAWLAAALEREGDPSPPDLGVLRQLLPLPRASDLGDPSLAPRFERFAREQRLGAAVALRAQEPHDAGAEAFAVILLGGANDRAGSVRPRTLAALDEAAARLHQPAATVRSLARLQGLDEGVRRLDRLALLGELLAEIAHEVRNPLVSVKTFLQLLPERLDDPEFHGEFRRVVADEVARLERLIENVLQHARPSTAWAQTDGADVERSFDAVAALLAHRARERGVTIHCQIDAPLPSTALARDALRQLLLNLALNAVDATPRGGCVTLRAHARPARGAEDGESAETIQIAVDDQGPGVAAELRERLFEPFFSTREDRPGGLGLAISRRLAEEAGGRLTAGDAPGGGARFALELPGRAPSIAKPR